MRRMSWIVALGTMMLTACAVESSSPPPAPAAQTSPAAQASVLSTAPAEAPSAAAASDEAPSEPRPFNQCIEFCPGEGCCSTSTGWVCC